MEQKKNTITDWINASGSLGTALVAALALIQWATSYSREKEISDALQAIKKQVEIQERSQQPFLLPQALRTQFHLSRKGISGKVQLPSITLMNVGPSAASDVKARLEQIRVSTEAHDLPFNISSNWVHPTSKTHWIGPRGANDSNELEPFEIGDSELRQLISDPSGKIYGVLLIRFKGLDFEYVELRHSFSIVIVDLTEQSVTFELRIESFGVDFVEHSINI